MRIGLSSSLKHDTPSQWAEKMKELGCGAVVFPVDYTAPEELIEAYAGAAKKAGLVIAKVGAWCNPVAPAETERRAAMERCIGQLKLADKIGANCCVNIAGSTGSRWDGAYKENFSEEHWEKTVKSIREIIDAAAPVNTYYTIEPMPWMVPKDPEEYERLITAVDRERFAVHMDLANWITSPEKYFNNEDFMEKCFDKLGSHIKSCHIKDVCLQAEFTFQLKETACGEGILNLEKYARLADRVNPQMPMIIEHLHSDDEYLESIAYLKARLEKAGVRMCN